MAVSKEIYAKVGRVLSECLGLDEDEITPEATLQGELGAESIDFLDIVFRLEREFGMHIPRGELFPESIFDGDTEFVREGRVTDGGVALLRAHMPYAELGSLDHDRRLRSVSDLFTVDLVARYVEWKLAQRDASVSPGSPPLAARSRTPASGLSVASVE